MTFCRLFSEYITLLSAAALVYDMNNGWMNEFLLALTPITKTRVKMNPTVGPLFPILMPLPAFICLSSSRLLASVSVHCFTCSHFLCFSLFLLLPPKSAIWFSYIILFNNQVKCPIPSLYSWHVWMSVCFFLFHLFFFEGIGYRPTCHSRPKCVVHILVNFKLIALLLSPYT